MKAKDLCRYAEGCTWYSPTDPKCNSQTKDREKCEAFRSLQLSLSSPYNKNRDAPSETDQSGRDDWGKGIFAERYIAENREGERP